VVVVVVVVMDPIPMSEVSFQMTVELTTVSRAMVSQT
jgi:hypothetical protein